MFSHVFEPVQRFSIFGVSDFELIINTAIETTDGGCIFNVLSTISTHNAVQRPESMYLTVLFARYSTNLIANSPLYYLVIWYRVIYAERQVTQWNFKNKGARTSPARLSYVLKVPLHYLHPSIIYFALCDWIMQRVLYIDLSS